jgi:hypothetical protein
MTLIFRFVTGVVLFAVLFVVFYIGSLVVGGGMAGVHLAAESGAQTYQGGYDIGREAGEKFAAAHGRTILMFSFIGSFVVAFGSAFSNFFPWCRSRT